MRHVIGVLAVLAMVGCGRPADGDDSDPDAGEVADAGPAVADAGEVDAGFDYCTSSQAAAVCGRAVTNVASCCNGLDDYIARSGADFCGYLALNTGAPAAACKDISGMVCTEVIAQGLCY